MAKPDWKAIRTDYIATGMAYATLAKKWKVPLSTVKKRAMREKWSSAHEEIAQQIEQEIAEEIGPQEEMEPAVPIPEEPEMEPELEMEPVPIDAEQTTPEERAHILRYNRAKRMLETTDAMMDRIIDALDLIKPDDTYALSTLIKALKDLREMQGLNKSALDVEEQRARIAKLKSEIRTTDAEGAGGVLILPTIEDRLLPPGENDG